MSIGRATTKRSCFRRGAALEGAKAHLLASLWAAQDNAIKVAVTSLAYGVSAPLAQFEDIVPKKLIPAVRKVRAKAEKAANLLVVKPISKKDKLAAVRDVVKPLEDLTRKVGKLCQEEFV